MRGRPGGRAGAAAPQVTYTLPADVVLPGRYAPRAGWWDAERGVWDEAGINEVVLERRAGGERVVRLSTQRLTALALLQVCCPAVGLESGLSCEDTIVIMYLQHFECASKAGNERLVQFQFGREIAGY